MPFYAFQRVTAVPLFLKKCVTGRFAPAHSGVIHEDLGATVVSTGCLLDFEVLIPATWSRLILKAFSTVASTVEDEFMRAIR